jgi:hypothetical protein
MTKTCKTTYFKICKPDSIVLFCHDTANDSISGIIEEVKKEGYLILRKNPLVINNVINNEYGMSLIRNAKVVDETEYCIACNVIDSIVNSPEWLISDNDIVQKDIVVAETIYV